MRIKQTEDKTISYMSPRQLNPHNYSVPIFTFMKVCLLHNGTCSIAHNNERAKFLIISWHLQLKQ